VRIILFTSLALLLSCSSDGGTTPATKPPLTGPALHHVLSTGQSNGIGFAAKPPLTSAQPYANVMFDSGVMTATDCDPDGCKTREEITKLVPLVEGDRYFADAVETMSSSLANEVSSLAAADHDVLVSVHARSGNIYECLRKGGCAFQDGKGYVKSFDDAMAAVEDGKRLAEAAGRPHVVTAVTAIHGESDHYDATFPLDGTDGARGAIKTYADALVEWQRDYEAGVRAITGQKEPVPLFVSQMANWNDRERSVIPSRQLEAHVRAPGKVILIGATYMLPFAADCIHYTNEGERRLGEYFAKAYASTVLAKTPWEPLRPLSATLEGDAVVVKFHVPKPPLVIDTKAVSDPGAYGFEIEDDSGATPAITDVSVTAPDAVRIQLAAAPAGANRRVKYAMRATPQTCPGPKTGPRGNLRDSDDTPSVVGYDLANWSVAFDLPIE
jgi:hypothetical protein